MSAIAWQPMATAPKDGREVRLRLILPGGVYAFWSDELERWVLSRPLHIETIAKPQAWAEK